MIQIARSTRNDSEVVSTGCTPFKVGPRTRFQNGGTLEKAQKMANHESARTTGLYDRSDDELTLEEVERIRI